MATTTNYGWTTPDDTDLVKDGAAAIRTLGSSVDTTTKNLNPSTTEGDIEYRSATANTNSRLAIGTAGQLLRVNSGANAPEWATVATGGMTLLNGPSGTTLSGATTTVDSYDMTYKSIVAFIFNIDNASNSEYTCSPNNSNTLATATGSGPDGVTDVYGGVIELTLNGVLDQTGSNAIYLQIDNYASTTAFKTYMNRFIGDMSTASFRSGFMQGGLATTSQITSLVFKASTGSFTAGTVLLYGVK